MQVHNNGGEANGEATTLISLRSLKLETHLQVQIRGASFLEDFFVQATPMTHHESKKLIAAGSREDRQSLFGESRMRPET